MSANSFWLAVKSAASSSSSKLPTGRSDNLDSDGRHRPVHDNAQPL
jgi:hypothetical protein